MAKDMLNAIFEAEEESKQRIAQADSKAEQDAEHARQISQKLVAEAKSQAEAKSKQELDELNIHGRAVLEKAELESKAQCEQLSQTAEKNRSNVVKKVVQMLT